MLLLSAVTYDGLQETAPFGSAMNALFTALLPVIGALNTVLAVQTLLLLGLWLAFLAIFVLASWLTLRMHDPDRQPPALGSVVGAYATTLLPIAGGYLIAHYLTLLIQGAVWIPTLVVDPLSTVAPPLDWIPISGVWYLSVAAIVIGHVAAVVLAHRRALRDSARRPILAGLPLVVLMIGYTVLSLWIIAQPITIEPGSTPAAPRPLMDVSLALAFAAGLLSFVSPCVLALVPVYLAFLGETAALAGPGQTTLTRAVRCSARPSSSSPASRSCSCCSGPRWDSSAASSSASTARGRWRASR